ncbi:hypothetical protein MP638_003729 [Amoeboaphelidium occidentale]|nr:hypothetical protein MP638_003729 [Amoeboaphelidium occidentale]
MHQKNKAFKSKHATKSSIKRRNKGKVERRVVTARDGPSNKIIAKHDRKNAAKIEQKKKREDEKTRNRLFSGHSGVPRIVAFVPLTPDANCMEIASAFDDTMKAKMKLVPLGRDFWEILDVCKVADCAVFVVSSQEEVDQFGNDVLSALRAQGMTSCFVVCPQLEDKSVKKSLASWAKFEFNDTMRIFNLPLEKELLFRAISQVSEKPKSYPHLIADCIDYDANNGVLMIEGYNRGKAFDPNRLVHLPDYGDFSLQKIVYSNGDVEMPSADPEERQLIPEESFNCRIDEEVDEDMEMETETRSTASRAKSLKGTSSYQAVWLSDEELSEDDNMDADDQMTMQSESESDDDELTKEEEEERRKEFRQRMEEEKEFPDEVEVPANQSAKSRFRKYRGLQSFKTSSWEGEDELPPSFDNIFMFENFRKTANDVFEDLEEEERITNVKIQLYLEMVPVSVAEFFVKHNCVVFGLLPHEEKMSMLNYTINLPNAKAEDVVLESKQPILIQSGYRRIVHHPIYSENSNHKNKLNRMLKFVYPGESAVATVFGPIQYSPVAVLYFKDNSTSLTGSGSLLSVDPDRKIIKRKLLTGVPTRIHPGKHNHTAVVRYMFHNPEDVQYFSPVELKTKLGRRGNIMESIGTHGAMKCRFDKALKSEDIILLPLYRRVFPKWPEMGYKSMYPHVLKAE